MKKEIDISTKTVKTTNGHAVVVTDQEERNGIRFYYLKRRDIILTEKYPASDAYKIISRDDQGKPVRRGYWIKQNYESGYITWKCRRCKKESPYREAFCPHCHSENKRVSNEYIFDVELDESEKTDENYDKDLPF